MGIIVGGNWCSVYFKATVWSSRCLYTYLWHASSHRRWRWALTWTVSTWKEAWPTRLSKAKMNFCCAPSALQTSTQSFGCTSRKGKYCTSGSRELVPFTWPASCWRVQKKMTKWTRAPSRRLVARKLIPPSRKLPSWANSASRPRTRSRKLKSWNYFTIVPFICGMN